MTFVAHCTPLKKINKRLVVPSKRESKGRGGSRAEYARISTFRA